MCVGLAVGNVAAVRIRSCKGVRGSRRITDLSYRATLRRRRSISSTEASWGCYDTCTFLLGKQNPRGVVNGDRMLSACECELPASLVRHVARIFARIHFSAAGVSTTTDYSAIPSTTK